VDNELAAVLQIMAEYTKLSDMYVKLGNEHNALLKKHLALVKDEAEAEKRIQTISEKVEDLALFGPYVAGFKTEAGE